MKLKSTQREAAYLVFEKLQESSLYQTYRRAFREATGLPLVIVFADDASARACRAAGNQNRFCQLLNHEETPCALCLETHEGLRSNVSERTRSVSCFAGLVETAVPVRSGRTTVALLKTGQIFSAPPTDEQIRKTLNTLRGLGYEESELRDLERAYAESPVVDSGRYRGMVTILTAFALQLSELANRIVLERGESEPAVVTKAKKFILEHLTESLSLNAVSREVNVSSFYFCKLFKQSTGLTFTQYVNCQRIEWAKRKLLEPFSRVTEVAFDVGYQSLSQFNRSFSRIVGESPTQYRQRMSRKHDRDQDQLVA